jgi:hypothetical protein
MEFFSFSLYNLDIIDNGYEAKKKFHQSSPKPLGWTKQIMEIFLNGERSMILDFFSFI